MTGSIQSQRPYFKKKAKMLIFHIPKHWDGKIRKFGIMRNNMTAYSLGYNLQKKKKDKRDYLYLDFFDVLCQKVGIHREKESKLSKEKQKEIKKAIAKYK